DEGPLVLGKVGGQPLQATAQGQAGARGRVQDVEIKEQVGKAVRLIDQPGLRRPLPGCRPGSQVQAEHLGPEQLNVTEIGPAQFDDAPQVEFVVGPVVELQELVEDDPERFFQPRTAQVFQEFDEVKETVGILQTHFPLLAQAGVGDAAG